MALGEARGHNAEVLVLYGHTHNFITQRVHGAKFVIYRADGNAGFGSHDFASEVSKA